jgi:hypothetical protein
VIAQSPIQAKAGENISGILAVLRHFLVRFFGDFAIYPWGER